MPAVERFVANTGVRIYRIPCEAFPNFNVYVHLLIGAGPITLVDTGSGYGDSNRQVLAGLETVRAEFHEDIHPADIRRVIITHGHIDHFGGLSYLVDEFRADVGIHPLDRWVLSAYEERVVVATKGIRFYLRQAGVAQDEIDQLMELYSYSKRHVRSVPVDFELSDGQELDGLRFLHTPGHCPGQVCIGVGDVLLSADHVLPRITPHQSPECITAWTGLGHFLEALDKLRRWSGGSFRVALGGHEGPIHDLAGRIAQIQEAHQRKLERLLTALADAAEPLTANDACQAIYPRAAGFHRLLALEEIGAHVEYLYQHGRLTVANLEEVEREENPPLRFRPA